MGYDQTRFLSPVDDEFICAICASVIENPVQTPCEHLFCNKCIKHWLDVNKTCPVDQRPLRTKDLSHPSRILRNLLNKLDIKCDFEQDGCQIITKLEHLGQHVSKCVHNLDAKVVCYNGCKITMTRREYLEHSCVLRIQVTKLKHELSEQKCHFERTLDSQAKENRKLRDEIDRQKEEIANLCAHISMIEPAKWQQIHNVKIGPENVLENEKEGFAFVQSAHALKSTKSSFEIHVINSVGYEFFQIGLTRRGCVRGFNLGNIESEFSNDSDSNFLNFLQCDNGDVIECGIEFPNDFIDDDKHSAQLYLSVNQELMFKETCVIPMDGLFPTMIFGGFRGKVRYCQKYAK